MYLCRKTVPRGAADNKNFSVALQVCFRESNLWKYITTYCFHICNMEISIPLWLAVVPKAAGPRCVVGATLIKIHRDEVSCHEVTSCSNVPKRISLYYNFISSLNNVYAISFECEPLNPLCSLFGRLVIHWNFGVVIFEATCILISNQVLGYGYYIHIFLSS